MQTTETEEHASKYLTVAEVAVRLHVSNGYVYTLLNKGELRKKHFGTGRKGVRVEITSVDEFEAAS